MQRKKKRVTGSRKSLKLYHSIPKKLKLSTFRHLSHVSDCSIPLVCMALLLLVGVITINPTLFDEEKSYAVEVGENSDSSINVSDNSNGVNTIPASNNDDSLDNTTVNEQGLENNSNSGLVNDAEGENDSELEVSNANGSTNNDAGIMTMADTQPTVNLTIGGAAVDEVVNATLGEVAYRSHTITVNVSDVQSYSLIITGNSTLTPPTGGATINATADGVKGSALADLTWGYAWGNTNETDENMNYYGLKVSGSNLTVPAVSNHSASFTRKLNFAAKFPTTAMTGNYVNSSVRLSLIATPVQVTGSWRDANGNVVPGLTTTATTMQGITAGFCKNNDAVKTGYTITLDDVRDNNEYVIYKSSDGSCWMGENLRLVGPRTLSPADSNVSGNWSMPASVQTWNMSSNTAVQIRTGTTNLTNWKQGYGNYYSWPAATAATGNATAIGADAASSICPKGWELPSLAGDGSFQILTSIVLVLG